MKGLTGKVTYLDHLVALLKKVDMNHLYEEQFNTIEGFLKEEGIAILMQMET